MLLLLLCCFSIPLHRVETVHSLLHKYGGEKVHSSFSEQKVLLLDDGNSGPWPEQLHNFMDVWILR